MPEDDDPKQFLSRWLEDESPFPVKDDYRGERRVDRHRRGSRGRPASRESDTPRSTKHRRSRVMSVVVLIVAAIVIAVVGLQTDEAVPGSPGAEDAVPFSLLPITGGPASTAAGSTTTTTSTTSTVTTATATTTATTPG